ncbi:MAG: hypothetical protein GC154_02740 [bacterium]|nr:hypothetical protein [bacterium]
MQHRDLIDSPERIAECAESLRSADIIAVDTEFIRERTFYPTLEIIQVATRSESWLIDARAFLNRKDSGGLGELRPLFDVLADPGVLKVLHAAQADQECFYTSFEITAQPSFDTALAAALLGYGDNISLRNLLRDALGIRIKKGHARSHWTMRPLPDPMITYALSDVEHLVELCEKLLDELDEKGRRGWAMELSRDLEDPRQYEPQPDEIAKRLSKSGRINSKTYPVLFELARWREDRIRELNIPRKWLVDDGVLLDLAETRPKDLKQLQMFRGIPKDEIAAQGERILAAIERGRQGEPRRPEPAPSSLKNEDSSVVDVLRCFLEIQAEKHGVASRFLISPRMMPYLFRSGIDCAQDLIDKGVLTQAAADLMGEELIDFLKGRRAIALRNGRVEIVASEATAEMDVD